MIALTPGSYEVEKPGTLFKPKPGEQLVLYLNDGTHTPVDRIVLHGSGVIEATIGDDTALFAPAAWLRVRPERRR